MTKTTKSIVIKIQSETHSENTTMIWKLTVQRTLNLEIHIKQMTEQKRVLWQHTETLTNTYNKLDR